MFWESIAETLIALVLLLVALPLTLLAAIGLGIAWLFGSKSGIGILN